MRPPIEFDVVVSKSAKLAFCVLYFSCRNGRAASSFTKGDVPHRADVELLDASGTGTIVPPGYINGLDVSDHNGTVNWATVANQGYKFAFIKAAEGITLA